MKTPTARGLRKYVAQCLHLQSYLRSPGDGRPQPRLPAHTLLWALLLGQVLRQPSFAAIEALARSTARAAAGISRRFGDDALGYFIERLDPHPTRRAAATAVRQAKRNKAFDHCRFIGLALDGTGAGHSRQQRCSLCRPFRNKQKEVVGYGHQLVMISIVGTGLSLPLDVEPYGPGDSEYAAGQRLLRRAVAHLGTRFADYVVADSKFATAPFLHAAGDLGLHVVARLKDNLPELLAAVEKRFGSEPPQQVFYKDGDRIEIWDADDFDPWDTLRWETVRVLRYRQHKPNGNVITADWITDFPRRRVGSRELFGLAKNRWEIENQVFNDAKNRHHLEHVCHHEPNSLLLGWLLTALALTIERLYRLRYLHRGTHPVCSAITLYRLLCLSLGRTPVPDTS